MHHILNILYNMWVHNVYINLIINATVEGGKKFPLTF